MQQQEIPLTAVAQRLKLKYGKCRDLLLCGQLEGRQDDKRRFYVTMASVNRYAEWLDSAPKPR